MRSRIDLGVGGDGVGDDLALRLQAVELGVDQPGVVPAEIEDAAERMTKPIRFEMRMRRSRLAEKKRTMRWRPNQACSGASASALQRHGSTRARRLRAERDGAGRAAGDAGRARRRMRGVSGDFAADP